MSKKPYRIALTIMAILAVASMLLSACTPTATPTAAPAVEEPAAPAEGSKLAVGIVLPTKDEPRWIQDETRFKEALNAAGYEVEILFSQGSSAKGKENVEALLRGSMKVETPPEGGLVLQVEIPSPYPSV